MSDDEDLARFILQSNHLRDRATADPKVKPGAFVPRPQMELSVTRHTGLAIEELWALGDDVATQRGRTLYGRADIATMDIRRIARELEVATGLQVLRDEPPRNHANIVGWPAENASQDMIALEICFRAKYVSR